MFFCSVPVLVTPQPWFWSPVFSATDMMPHHIVLEVPQLQDHKLTSHCTLNTVCFYRNISTLTMENKDFSYFSTLIPQYILVSLIPKCLICKLLFESLIAFFQNKSLQEHTEHSVYWWVRPGPCHAEQAQCWASSPTQLCVLNTRGRVLESVQS